MCCLWKIWTDILKKLVTYLPDMFIFSERKRTYSCHFHFASFYQSRYNVFNTIFRNNIISNAHSSPASGTQHKWILISLFAVIQRYSSELELWFLCNRIIINVIFHVEAGVLCGFLLAMRRRIRFGINRDVDPHYFQQIVIGCITARQYSAQLWNNNIGQLSGPVTWINSFECHYQSGALIQITTLLAFQ